MMEDSRKAIIVGGGISGLAAAYYLYRFAKTEGIPLKITLLEKEKSFGGKIFTLKKAGFSAEAGPDSIVSYKKSGTDFLMELGLTRQFIKPESSAVNTYILSGAVLKPLPPGITFMTSPDIWEILKTGLLSPRGKLRVLFSSLTEPEIEKNADISLSDFVRKKWGREVLDNIISPLLGNIYSTDPSEMSIASTFPQLLYMPLKPLFNLFRKKNKKNETSPFISLRDGMFSLINKLTGYLTESGVELISDRQVLEIGYRKGKYRVGSTGARRMESDILILTLPYNHAKPLLSGILNEESGLLPDIPFTSSATVSLGYKENPAGKKFPGTGFIIPENESEILSACTFVSSKWANRSPKDKILLRLFLKHGKNPRWQHQSDREIIGGVKKELQRILYINSEPVFRAVFRFKNSMPQYTVGHGIRLVKLDGIISGFKGLYLTGESYRGIGIPDCVKNAALTAGEIISYLKNSG